MYVNNITAESCFILNNPSCLTMEIMRDDIRAEIIQKFDLLIKKYNLKQTKVVNVRDSNLIQSVNADTLIEYYNFLSSYKIPVNVEQERFNLVKFLKSFETIRKNSILDYAPRYSEFLRHYGY